MGCPSFRFCHQQQAVIEKFALCEETLSGLLKWISQVEQKIATVGGPKERIDELRNQINSLKVSFRFVSNLWPIFVLAKHRSQVDRY
jgi:hypothetical protein